jgi:class 3 adenylate cyclase
MAIFPESADHAVQAALDIQQAVAAYNLDLQDQRLPALRIGAGLHTGHLMLGVIGEVERLQGTVISDAVNLAARLDQLTRTFDSAIIISEQTLQHLNCPAVYSTRFLDRVRVKGKQTFVSIYAVQA